MPLTLRQLADRLRAASDATQAIATVQHEITAVALADLWDRMSQGKQPDGTAQTPIKNPRPSGNDGPPLVDHGHLLGSARAEVRGTTLFVSTSGPGARRHQKTRPHLGLSPSAKWSIGKLVMAGFLRRLHRLG